MNEQLFTELLESVREGAAIMRGEQEPSRKFTSKNLMSRKFESNQRYSQRFNLPLLLGISVEKRCKIGNKGGEVPRGPARVLLQVAAKHPEAVWDVVPAGKLMKNRLPVLAGWCFR